MVSPAWESLTVGKVGVTLEVAQHEGDPRSFKSAPAIVNALLEDRVASGELADFCIDLSLLLLPLSVADNFCIGFPVREFVGGFGEGIEPSGCSREQLKEPHPYGVSWDA